MGKDFKVIDKDYSFYMCIYNVFKKNVNEAEVLYLNSHPTKLQIEHYDSMEHIRDIVSNEIYKKIEAINMYKEIQQYMHRDSKVKDQIDRIKYHDSIFRKVVNERRLQDNKK